MMRDTPIQAALRTFLAGYSTPSADQVRSYQIALRTMDADEVIRCLPFAQDHFAERRPNPGQLKKYLEGAAGGPRKGAGGISRVSGDSEDRVPLEPGYRAVVSYGSVLRAGAQHLVPVTPVRTIRTKMDNRHELYHGMAGLARTLGMPWPPATQIGTKVDMGWMVTITLPHGGWWARGLGVAMHDEFGSATLIAKHKNWTGPVPDDVYTEGQDAFVEMGS